MNGEATNCGNPFPSLCLEGARERGAASQNSEEVAVALVEGGGQPAGTSRERARGGNPLTVFSLPQRPPAA